MDEKQLEQLRDGAIEVLETTTATNGEILEHLIPTKDAFELVMNYISTCEDKEILEAFINKFNIYDEYKD